MIRQAKYLIVVAALIALTACASLGLAPASSFSDRLAYGYATQTAVLNATTSALGAGEITSDDAERVLSVSDKAREALDAARVAMTAGDISSAEGRLQLAVALLSELQGYLRRTS